MELLAGLEPATYSLPKKVYSSSFPAHLSFPNFFGDPDF